MSSSLWRRSRAVGLFVFAVSVQQRERKLQRRNWWSLRIAALRSKRSNATSTGMVRHFSRNERTKNFSARYRLDGGDHCKASSTSLGTDSLELTSRTHS